jgi:hypothetical protein
MPKFIKSEADIYFSFTADPTRIQDSIACLNTTPPLFWFSFLAYHPTLIFW